jgi:hypothetical protein
LTHFPEKGTTKALRATENQVPSPEENSPKETMEVPNLEVIGFGTHQRIEISYMGGIIRNKSTHRMTAHGARVWGAQTEAGGKRNRIRYGGHRLSTHSLHAMKSSCRV